MCEHACGAWALVTVNWSPWVLSHQTDCALWWVAHCQAKLDGVIYTGHSHACRLVGWEWATHKVIACLPCSWWPPASSCSNYHLKGMWKPRVKFPLTLLSEEVRCWALPPRVVGMGMGDETHWVQDLVTCEQVGHPHSPSVLQPTTAPADPQHCKQNLHDVFAE